MGVVPPVPRPETDMTFISTLWAILVGCFDLVMCNIAPAGAELSPNG